ncbi:MAG: hypothetical protein ACRDZ4_23430 [Egibacteraceae bacterium]
MTCAVLLGIALAGCAPAAPESTATLEPTIIPEPTAPPELTPAEYQAQLTSSGAAFATALDQVAKATSAAALTAGLTQVQAAATDALAR